MSQGHPYRNLDAFPTVVARKRTALWRIVPAARATSPWWYSNTGDGRFDLHPHSSRGTCYLAASPLGALLETVWRDAAPTGDPDLFPPLAPAELAQLRAVAVTVPARHTCADARGENGAQLHPGFGITDAIGTCDSYQRPQEWAAAWDAHGLAGVAYRLAHGSGLFGWAFFGPAGAADHEAASDHELDDSFLTQWNITVAPVPSLDELTVVDDATTARAAIDPTMQT